MVPATIIERLVEDVPRVIEGAVVTPESLEKVLNLVESYGYKLVPINQHVDAEELTSIFNNLLPEGVDDIPGDVLLAELQHSGYMIIPPLR